MAVDFSGASISCLWNMLYDDNYIPDDRSIENGTVLVIDPTVPVLCSLYSDFTGNHGSERNLFLPAGRRYFNHNRMCPFDQAYEEGYFKKYEIKEKNN